jgi:MSHA biogenesis protein MshK
MVKYLMTKHMLNNCNKYWVTGLSALLSVLNTSGVMAEALRDPTTPPAQLLQVEGGPAEVYSVPVLQSVKLGSQTKAAMINGETVLLGQKYGGAKLVKVTETQAVLKSADGKEQVLSMSYPIERNWLTSGTGRQKESKQKPGESHDE